MKKNLIFKVLFALAIPFSLAYGMHRPSIAKQEQQAKEKQQEQQEVMEQMQPGYGDDLREASLKLSNLMSIANHNDNSLIDYPRQYIKGARSIHVRTILEDTAEVIKQVQEAIKQNTSIADKATLESSIKNTISDLKLFIQYYLKKEDQLRVLRNIKEILPNFELVIFVKDMEKKLQSVNQSIENVMKTSLNGSVKYTKEIQNLLERAAQAYADTVQSEAMRENPILESSRLSVEAKLIEFIQCTLEKKSRKDAIRLVKQYMWGFSLPKQEFCIQE